MDQQPAALDVGQKLVAESGALGGALASAGSYGAALWAMTQAPVATVAALRETSVLFAALLGTWLLKEAFSLRRAVATAAIKIVVRAP